MKRYLAYLLWVPIIAAISCQQSHRGDEKTFTKADSLTETYLILQDSMLHSWNVMIKDEREKIKALHALVKLMKELTDIDEQQLHAIEQRIDQLERIRFTQKSLGNPYLIDEYDFASGSVISEILSLAEVDPATINHAKLQKLVDQIKAADQRVLMYRSAYDKITQRFNEFIETNRNSLHEIDAEVESDAKPLFQATSEN